MIRIRTPSRLHFGLLSLPGAHPKATSIPRRLFGGVGLMIERPGIELTVAPASTWSARGPLADRALQFARTYCAAVGITAAFDLNVVAAASDHIGLGTGTQLGLAVARAIAELTDQPLRSAADLAQMIGRGVRSAIGVHGFDHGGFLIDGGKRSADSLAPLLGRWHFPPDWPILLIFPPDRRGAHGPRESDAFADLKSREPNEALTEAMSRLVLLGLLPALVEKDLVTFGAAIHEYNRLAGELFRTVQGGTYADGWVAEAVRRIRATGAAGVGQSSWGPTAFAIGADVSPQLRCLPFFADAQFVATSAANHGASMD